MNMHCALDDCVRRLRIHHVEHSVDHFIASDSKNRSTQNLFRFCIDADFDETLCLTFFVGSAHLTHRVFRSKGTTSGLPYLCVRHAASPEWRIDIQRVGLDPVGNPAMVSVEEIVRNDLVVVIGSVRKGTAAIAVSQCPDAGHVRLQRIINDDVAAGVGGNPSPVQTQVVCVGSTPNGQKNVRAYYFWRTFFACEADGDIAIALRQRDTFRIQPDVYALSLQDFAHSLGNVFILPSNQARSHFHNRDFAPEAAIDLSELQPNITSADDDEMLGQEIDVHYRRVGKKWDVVNPRHVGNTGPRTNIDIDLAGLQNFIVDHDSVR